MHVTYEKEDRVLILAFKVRKHTTCVAACAPRLCFQTMRRILLNVLHVRNAQWLLLCARISRTMLTL